MNVGIYIGRIDALEGGGHTFQNMVMDALSHLQAESPDDFFLLYEGTNKPPFSIPGISLQPEIQTRVRNRIRRLTRSNEESSLQHMIRKHAIDFVWYPSYHFAPVDVPYVYTVWDLQHRLQPMFPEVSVGQEWNRREAGFQAALKKASYILTGTDRGVQEISLFYQIPGERIRKLPHPTPPLHQQAGADINHLIAREHWGNYILYPAQFWPHKNHIRIIEAIHELKTKHQFVLHAVLSGSDKGTLNYLKSKASEFGIQDQMHFLGFVSSEELVSLYKNAFALCYVTLFGPENLPPLEAFSLDCPAIVSEVPGAREQYGSAALFFNPLHGEDLAKRLLELKNQRGLREDLVAKGKQRAGEYTPDHYVKDIFNVLNEFRQLRKTWASE